MPPSRKRQKKCERFTLSLPIGDGVGAAGEAEPSADDPTAVSAVGAGDPDREGPSYFVGLPVVHWEITPLVGEVQSVFKESREARARSTAEHVQGWLESHGVAWEGEDLPNPIESFDEAHLPASARKVLTEKGVLQPTPIQCLTIPAALQGRDVIAIAITGSGKTLAFVIPALAHVRAQPELLPGEGPAALLLCPTRELAVQTYEMCHGLAGSELSCCCVFGGASKLAQGEMLKGVCHVLAATPGRLLDLRCDQLVSLLRVVYLVIDEADRMLSMGLGIQLAKLKDQVRPRRQTLMFSATWPESVQNLAHEYLTRPLKFQVGSVSLAANKGVRQAVYLVRRDDEKPLLLMRLLGYALGRRKMVIFVNTRYRCQALGEVLKEAGYAVFVIHGNVEQDEREWELVGFAASPAGVLVATDVAARGLDFQGIELVLNYDFPHSVQTYVHRIGRTARAGATGESHSFFDPTHHPLARALADVMREAGQLVPTELEEIASRQDPLAEVVPGKLKSKRERRRLLRVRNTAATSAAAAAE
eukprot:RCo052882